MIVCRDADWKTTIYVWKRAQPVVCLAADHPQGDTPSPSPSTFFFPILSCGCLSLLSSCGPAYPIRLWRTPAKGRLTMPIREDRAAAPLHMHYFKWASSLWKGVDKLHRLLCKQMSFSSCAGSATWRDLLRTARQGRARIFGNMSTSNSTSRQLKASHNGFVWRVRPNFQQCHRQATSTSLRHQQMAP